MTSKILVTGTSVAQVRDFFITLGLPTNSPEYVRCIRERGKLEAALARLDVGMHHCKRDRGPFHVRVRINTMTRADEPRPDVIAVLVGYFNLGMDYVLNDTLTLATAR